MKNIAKAIFSSTILTLTIILLTSMLSAGGPSDPLNPGDNVSGCGAIINASGTYNLNQSVILEQSSPARSCILINATSNVTLNMSGYNITNLNYGNKTSGIAVLNSQNITILGHEDHIKNFNYSVNGNLGKGIIFDNVTDSFIKNVSLEHNAEGITLFGNNNTLVYKNTLYNNSIGVFLAEGSNYINITGNNFTSNTQYGIEISPDSSVTNEDLLEDNHFENNEVNISQMLTLTPGPIDSCGMIMNPGTYNLTTNLIANESTGEQHYCFFIESTDNVTINLNGSNITRGSTLETSSSAIQVFNSSNVTINGQGGYIKDFNLTQDDSGIFYVSSSNGLIHNVSFNNTMVGIGIFNESNNVNVSNNNFTNNELGLLVMGGSSFVLDDNSFENNGLDIVQEEDGVYKINLDFELLDSSVPLEVYSNNDFVDETINITFLSEWNITLNPGDNETTVSIPENTVAYRSDGPESDFHLHNFSLGNVSFNDLSGLGDLAGAVEFGLPDLGLNFSNNITINLSVTAEGVSDGDNLSIFRSIDGSNWVDEGLANLSCTVASGACLFEANKASYYALGELLPYNITFNVFDEGGDSLNRVRIDLYEENGDNIGDVDTGETNKAVFLVDNGTYTYIAFKKGYIDIEHEEVVVSGENVIVNVTLMEADYTVTFNVTNSTNGAISDVYISVYSDGYGVDRRGIKTDENGTVQLDVEDKTTYIYIASASDKDNKIRYGDTFDVDGANKTIDVTLKDFDASTFEGRTLFPNGTVLEDVNVSVWGMTEAMFHDQHNNPPELLGSNTSNSTGDFIIQGLDETIGGVNISKYIIKMEKHEGDVLRYISESYLTWVDIFLFGQLEKEDYYLSNAVTFNVVGVGTPEYLVDNVSFIENNSVLNYSHSLVWMTERQWAYITEDNNITILNANLSSNRSFNLPVEDAQGLYYNGSHFFTMNSTESLGNTSIWHFNATGGDENNSKIEDYVYVSAIEFYNDKFYVMGNNGSDVVDKYNDDFTFNETVLEDIHSFGDMFVFEDRWYHITDDINIYNATWGDVMRVRGDKFNGFSLDSNFTGIAHNGEDWFIASNETGNISKVHLTDKGIKYFDYQIMDYVLDKELVTNHHDGGDEGVNNVSFEAIADREFLLRLDKKFTPLQINMYIADVTDMEGWNETRRELNLSVNLTEEIRRVSGTINYDGETSFTNISVVYQEIDESNMATHAGGYNRSGAHGIGDIYDPAAGSYDIGIINPAGVNSSYILFITAYNGSEHYGAIKKITLEPGEGDITGFNASLKPLLGQEDNLSAFPPEPGYINITTKLKKFQFVKNGEVVSLEDYGAEVYMDYTKVFNDSTKVIWRRDSGDHTPNSNSTGFEIPVFGEDGMYVHLYAKDYFPLSYSLTDTRLEGDGVINITLRDFNETLMSLDEGETPNIETFLYKGNTTDYPYPNSEDIIYSGYVGQEPLKVRMEMPNDLLNLLGGEMSFRMRDIKSGVSIHYSNVDGSRSGAPDAMFSSQAKEFEDFSNFWQFGSAGPKIYEKVLISMPYDESLTGDIIVKIPYLYDDNFTIIWKLEDGIEEVPEYYSAYTENESYKAYLEDGVECDENNDKLENGLCYMDTVKNLLWFEIPHFSAIGLNVEGTETTTNDEDDDEDDTTDTVSPGAPSDPSDPEDDDEEAPSFWNHTHVVSDEEFQEGFSSSLKEGQRFSINVSGETHHVGVVSLTNTTAIINVSSNPQQKTLSIGKEWKVDVKDDGFYDVLVTLINIDENGAQVGVERIHEEIEEVVDITTVTDEEPEDDLYEEVEEKRGVSWFVWVILGLIIVIAGIIAIHSYNKKGPEHNEKPGEPKKPVEPEMPRG